jgi:hypothetical protein
MTTTCYACLEPGTCASGIMAALPRMVHGQRTRIPRGTDPSVIIPGGSASQGLILGDDPHAPYLRGVHEKGRCLRVRATRKMHDRSQRSPMANCFPPRVTGPSPGPTPWEMRLLRPGRTCITNAGEGGNIRGFRRPVVHADGRRPPGTSAGGFWRHQPTKKSLR